MTRKPAQRHLVAACGACFPSSSGVPAFLLVLVTAANRYWCLLTSALPAAVMTGRDLTWAREHGRKGSTSNVGGLNPARTSNHPSGGSRRSPSLSELRNEVTL
jgi:hypothetical protein